MSSKLPSSQTIIYQLILFLSFSLSVNYFTELKIVNFFSYVLFHLTLIYFMFYYFNFFLFFLYFLYGIFFDIFLINYISPHLISFLILISLFYLLKKYLLNLSSNRISFIILLIALILFALEALISYTFFNYPIDYKNLTNIFLTTTVIFIPILLLFSKIDKI